MLPLTGANWSLVASFVDQTSRLKGFLPQPRFRRSAQAAPSPAPPAAVAADKAAAANGSSGGAVAAETAAGPSRGRRSSWSSGRRTIEEQEADEYEVPFGPAPVGLAAARASETSPPGHGLEVSLLRIAARGPSLPGSFYDGGGAGGTAADVAAAAAASAAAPAVSSALAGAGGGRRPGSLHSGSFAAGAEGEEEVEMLFSQEPGKAATDFDAAWQQSVATPARATAAAPTTEAAAAAAAAAEEVQRAAAASHASAAAASASAAASQAAARMVQQRIGAFALHRQAAASRGSTRDLLGRLQPESAGGVPPSVGPTPSGQQGVSAALLTRAPSKVISQALVRARSVAALSSEAAASSGAAADLEAGLGGPAGGSPKHASGSEPASEEGSQGGLSSLQDQRLRVLNGLKRHFRAKRRSGLLSPEGLRIAMWVLGGAGGEAGRLGCLDAKWAMWASRAGCASLRSAVIRPAQQLCKPRTLCKLSFPYPAAATLAMWRLSMPRSILTPRCACGTCCVRRSGAVWGWAVGKAGAGVVDAFACGQCACAAQGDRGLCVWVGRCCAWQLVARFPSLFPFNPAGRHCDPATHPARKCCQSPSLQRILGHPRRGEPAGWHAPLASPCAVLVAQGGGASLSPLHRPAAPPPGQVGGGHRWACWVALAGASRACKGLRVILPHSSQPASLRASAAPSAGPSLRALEPWPLCSKMLIACEVTVELYMGLAASPQMQVRRG